MDLVAKTVDLMARWLRHWPNAVVLWSGGKDSTALLHLLRQVPGGKDVPIVQYREPRFRHRYAFSDRIIKEWDLTVHDYVPTRIALADGPDQQTGAIRFDLLYYYPWGQTALVISLGSNPPEEGGPYLCGVKDVLQRPTGNFNWPWDACWIGSKSADVDLIKGHVPLAMDCRKVPGGPWTLYPLRNWTDEQIFSYLEAQPGDLLDPTRYVKHESRWQNNPDTSNNADFYPVCWNCVNRHAGPHVWCPRAQANITNISDTAPYEDLEFPELGFRRTWPTTNHDHHSQQPINP
jgi:hypothetical protein